MEYIRSSRIPAVALTAELAAPSPSTVITPAVDTPAIVIETLTERAEPSGTLVEITEVTPATTKQRVGVSIVRSRMSEAAKMVKDFMRFNPTYFTGVGDPEIAGCWLMTHQRLHQLLKVPEADQVRISGYYLRGQAEVWWTTYTDTHSTPSTWAEFRQIFLDEYIPTEVQARERAVAVIAIGNHDSVAVYGSIQIPYDVCHGRGEYRDIPDLLFHQGSG
ncbi:hypothetical protein Sjap_015378 [Stephania japonica]|uniref:Retrotransposon gag domain-containing protein n=1 Tax=Stephania japonica TaxID=461633 RepID=A0AAP0IKK3_9MAGN